MGERRDDPYWLSDEFVQSWADQEEACPTRSMARALLALRAEVDSTWRVLGLDPDETRDDPDVATLPGAVAVTLQYERDTREMLAEAVRVLRAREERLRAALSALVRAIEDTWTHEDDCPAADGDDAPEDAECQCMPMAVDDAFAALAGTAINSDASPREAFDLRAHLQRQREWSERTFGPGSRAAGVIDHIRKELREIEADPTDLEEWIDVVILALDGAWRSGATPDQIIAQLVAKQATNEARAWPDWRTQPTDRAIEHVRAERPERCPRCDSPAPHLHPAMRHEGEVQPCSDAWHASRGGAGVTPV